MRRPLKTDSLSLTHSLAIDNKTTFEKDSCYQTLDLHFNPKGLELLLEKQPCQLERVMNAYGAGRQSSFLHSDFKPTADILKVAAKIERYLLNPYMEPAIMNNLAFSLLLKILALQEEQFGLKNLDPKLQKRLRLIEAVSNLLLREIDRQGHSLKELARSAETNQKYFADGIKYLHNMGINQFITQRRLDKALELLLTTDLPVKEIAILAGYNNPNHLYPAFREVYEYTPERYRSFMHELAAALYLP
ncbi:AraC-type DNA-binding protein [Arachidicoccus rhizosphaerae]|uniref:AraC-type DNA-binding protein n=1 Tax=Arachidicoccus rhizosphaerae TaxID=551991 RepID=A0A1H4A328_9BACT|nr:AraC family transcriptional regulator [Arachidicoccus rhizosphaerae]SEA30041.1 AraC-type DNA-binding protein [Arachidicoccus rhizosphaerae]